MSSLNVPSPEADAALRALEARRNAANEEAFRVATPDTTVKQAFLLADDLLLQAVRALTDLMVLPGVINLDFADIREALVGGGRAIIGTGDAAGPNRAMTAAQQRDIPTAMIGQSVGPFDDPADAEAWLTVAARCDLLTVRESVSHSYLVDKLGLPEHHVQLSSDPAFLLPTATEVPPIEFGHVEIPGPGVGGYKGVGEGGAIGSTPAVINAINDALAPLGVTLTRLPASPAAIVELLEQAQK